MDKPIRVKLRNNSNISRFPDSYMVLDHTRNLGLILMSHPQKYVTEISLDWGDHIQVHFHTFPPFSGTTVMSDICGGWRQRQETNDPCFWPFAFWTRCAGLWLWLYPAYLDSAQTGEVWVPVVSSQDGEALCWSRGRDLPEITPHSSLRSGHLSPDLQDRNSPHF